jgi:phosphoglycerol transferase MdoB-like AlkP superfamily enzyme
VTRAGDSARGDAGNEPRPWEIRVAWLLRLLILATATVHVLQGKYLYALVCIAAIAVLVAPSLLVRTSRANMPVEVELAVLWGAVGDMTLGRMAGLYGTVWFDKLLHFGNSLLIGVLAFLIVYALRFTGRLQTSSLTNGVVILLLALGVGAFWEITEYLADLVFHEGSQGSPAMAPLDDTMWDLILDGVGGALGGLAGSIYMRHSKRTGRRLLAFARLVGGPDRGDTGPGR